MSVHAASKRGRRDQNEDKHNIILNLDGNNKDKSPINFFGLYDGHGGKFVSEFLEHNIAKCFMNKNVKYPLKSKYVYKVYNYIQDILKKDTSNKNKSKALSCGSTCLIIIQFNDAGKQYINVLNTGDTRAVICTSQYAITLTEDHKPNSQKESTRLAKIDGKVWHDGYDWRICDLSVSRAFGDIDSEPFVINKPDISLYEITNKDKFIVLACDGLWDMTTGQEVIDLVLKMCYDDNEKRINRTINIAKFLVDYSIKKGSTDNVSVIVIFLD